MEGQPYQGTDVCVVVAHHLQQLLAALGGQGYRTVGPTVRDGAIVYAELTSTDELPVGWTDRQDGGTYRLERRGDGASFGYTVGPQSWKQFLHPPLVRLWRSTGTSTGFQIEEAEEDTPRFAFVGVRPCELQAIRRQDRVFMQGAYVDPIYASRRQGAFILAVNCGQAGGTCFCASMGTGPRVDTGYDLALTELLPSEGHGSHRFLVEIGSERGRTVLEQVDCHPAVAADVAAAEQIVSETARHMGRTLDTAQIADLLYRNYEHAQWDRVAERCLTCGNCTLACPTCFCTTVEDATDLTGTQAERWRKWDSCFTLEFSVMHGSSVRSSARARYRQWLTHKLAGWLEQFGALGCVGCGRCITWCPVGIDLTQEIDAIRRSDGASVAALTEVEVENA